MALVTTDFGPVLCSDTAAPSILPALAVSPFLAITKARIR